MYDKACDLYEEIVELNIQPDNVMYGCLVKFAVKCGRTELSQLLFSKTQGGDAQNYMWLIRSAGREQDASRGGPRCAARVLELLRRAEASHQPKVDIAIH